jgi:purine-nucleoside phosphorylase
MTQGQKILQIAAKYNKVDDLLLNAYNISSNERFDAVIVAPTWTPYRIGGFPIEGILNCKEARSQNNSTSQSNTIPMMKRLNESFIVEWDGFRLAWLKTGTCAGNVIDSTLFLANIHTDRFIFLGAAGGIVPGVKLGEIVTPSCCINGVGATKYFFNENGTENSLVIEPKCPALIDQIIKQANQRDIVVSTRKVFCTDTILGEYLHMNEITATGAEVIEMETSAFYCAANLIEKPAIALLVISDNFTIGSSLSAPRRDVFENYNKKIKTCIPRLISIACQAKL